MTIDTAAARAALEHAGWRPIESAPRDGRRIRVAAMTDMYGWVQGTAYWAGSGFVSGWVASQISDPPGVLGLGNPSRWKPLDTPDTPDPLAAHLKAALDEVERLRALLEAPKAADVAAMCARLRTDSRLVGGTMGRGAADMLERLAAAGADRHLPPAADDARKLLEGLPEAPWVVIREDHGGRWVRNRRGLIAKGPRPCRYEGQDERYAQELAEYEAVAEFIAWCRDGVPALLSELDAARQRIAQLEADMSGKIDGWQTMDRAGEHEANMHVLARYYDAHLNSFLMADLWPCMMMDGAVIWYAPFPRSTSKVNIRDEGYAPICWCSGPKPPANFLNADGAVPVVRAPDLPAPEAGDV